MKPGEKKNKHQVQQILWLTSRDAALESQQVRPESLEPFKPSYASSKAKNENNDILNWISDEFDKQGISNYSFLILILNLPHIKVSHKCQWGKE